MGKQNLIILDENCTSDSFQALHNLQIPMWSFKAKKHPILRTRFVLLALSKALERLNK